MQNLVAAGMAEDRRGRLDADLPQGVEESAAELVGIALARMRIGRMMLAAAVQRQDEKAQRRRSERERNLPGRRGRSAARRRG